MRCVIALTGAFVLAIVFPVESSNIPPVWTAPLLASSLKGPAVCGYAFQEGVGPLICGHGPVENALYRGDDGYVLTSQKPAESIAIAPETAQEIITAYEAQENARLAYVAAQAKADAVLNKAKAQAKCWPCSLNRNAQGQLVLIPDPPPKETPK